MIFVVKTQFYPIPNIKDKQLLVRFQLLIAAVTITIIAWGERVCWQLFYMMAIVDVPVIVVFIYDFPTACTIVTREATLENEQCF